MRFAILGIGEAGGALATDLLAGGATVYGWDPEPKNIPNGLRFKASNADAASRADLILSVNWARVSVEVAEEVRPVLGEGQLYADLNTASPSTKQRAGEIAGGSGALFADVAIMAPVPPKGIGTPMLASGPGASMFRQLMTPFGTPVALLDDQAGSAAQRKLLRSTFYKGVAAVVIEALEAAGQLGLEAWLREQMLTIIANEQIIDRLVTGSRDHAQRRVDEMEAVSEMLRELGVEPLTSEASRRRLIDIQQRAKSANSKVGTD